MPLHRDGEIHAEPTAKRPKGDSSNIRPPFELALPDEKKERSLDRGHLGGGGARSLAEGEGKRGEGM